MIAGKEIVKGSQSGAATIPASLLAKVQELPEVAEAGGALALIASNEAEIVGRDGKALGSDGAPRFGIGNDASQPQFSPLQLKTGEWPAGPRQVALDAGTAAGEKLKVGDTVTVSTLGAKHRYEVTGIAGFGGVDSLGGATIAIWDMPTAQTLLHKEGRYDTISIAAKEGTSPEELVRAVQPLVPASLQVKDSEAQAAADAKETNVIVNVVRYFLLGFGGIALFVGAFVIFNTLSITVAQRTREFATLRTLGASRKQVMRSVVIEGLVIGLLASVVGLFAGVGLAKLLTSLGGDLPEVGLVFTLRTVLVSLALGTGITLLASVMPARRATRVPPIAAVREGSTLPPSRFAGHSRNTAIAVIAASIAAISVGIFAGGLGTLAVALLLGLGVLALFVGVALAAPHMIKPLTRLVGLPARRSGGVAGELASSNSVRHPGRTASTAAALMIGLTLVTVVAVLRLRTAQHRRVGRHRSSLGGVHPQRQRRHALRGRRGRRARARARREHALPRPRRQGARGRPGEGRHRRRPGDDRTLLPVRVDRRLRRGRRPTEDRRRAGDADLRLRPGPGGRRKALDPDRVRRPPGSRRAGHL